MCRISRWVPEFNRTTPVKLNQWNGFNSRWFHWSIQAGTSNCWTILLCNPPSSLEFFFGGVGVAASRQQHVPLIRLLILIFFGFSSYWGKSGHGIAVQCILTVWKQPRKGALSWIPGSPRFVFWNLKKKEQKPKPRDALAFTTWQRLWNFCQGLPRKTKP